MEYQPRVSVDLLKSTMNQMSFLRLVDQHPALYEEQVIKRAWYRYETFWFPLASKHRSMTLVPPLDIAWVWHVHMLFPSQYRDDCYQTVGLIIPHRPITSQERFELSERTRALWVDSYGDVEPFDVDLKLSTGINAPPPPIPRSFKSKLQTDILEGVRQQRLIIYQVSLPHYTRGWFIEAAVRRYKKFLCLKKSDAFSIYIPLPDIHLVFHTHQLHPVEYYRDTKVFTGKIIDHNDSGFDGIISAAPSGSEVITREEWQKLYGEEYYRPGASHRGVLPQFYLNSAPLKQLSYLIEIFWPTELSNFVLVKVPKQWLYYFLTVHLKMPNRKKKLIADYHGILNRKQQKPVEVACETSASKPTVTVELLARSRNTMCRCLAKFITVTEHFRPNVSRWDKNVQENPVNSTHTAMNVPVQFSESTGINQVLALVDIVGEFRKPSGKVLVLSLKPGKFVRTEVFKTVDAWGPCSFSVPLDITADSQRTSYPTDVAKHTLESPTGAKGLSVRVLKCPAVGMSAVQVFSGDEFSALAHTVGSDQLPELQEDERAMIVKGPEGDFALCVGKYATREVDFGMRPEDDSSTHLELHCTILNSERCHQVSLAYDDEFDDDSTCRVESFFSLDMVKGEIGIIKPEEHYLEKIAMAFCVPMISAGLYESQPCEDKRLSKISSLQRAHASKTRKPAASSIFLRAVGWSPRQQQPSNVTSGGVGYFTPTVVQTSSSRSRQNAEE